MIDRTGQSLYLQDSASKTQGQQSQTQSLGKNDFLKLLIAQLKNQSPAKPMDDQQFISQMATFSTLEQMTNMNSELKQFLQGQSANDWVANTQLIGKEVKWKKTDAEGGGSGNGIIQSVNFKNGQVSFITEAGKSIDKSQILEVGLSSANGGGA